MWFPNTLFVLQEHPMLQSIWLRWFDAQTLKQAFLRQWVISLRLVQPGHVVERRYLQVVTGRLGQPARNDDLLPMSNCFAVILLALTHQAQIDSGLGKVWRYLQTFFVILVRSGPIGLG